MTDLLVTKDQSGITKVTLNRPDVHNAFNDDLIQALDSTFKDLAVDPKVKVIVLHGAGKSFCAGADLNWMKKAGSYTDEENFIDAMKLSDMLAQLNFCPKPIIAALHGAVFGGGVGLTAVADIAIASESTKFSLSEAKLGLTPATISPFVIAAIGQRQGRRYFQTAERFTAATAQLIGLVHEVAGDPLARALDIAATMLANAPGAMADSKQLVFDVANRPIDDIVRQQTAANIAARRASDEGKEGLAAFLEKRAPNWITGGDND